MYTVHLRLIGKLIVDFLLVIIELFRLELWLRCYERKSIENRHFRRKGLSLAQNFRYKGRRATIILPVTKLDEWIFYMIKEF